eukprot:3872064-Rhodomonas_salina.1
MAPLPSTLQQVCFPCCAGRLFCLFWRCCCVSICCQRFRRLWCIQCLLRWLSDAAFPSGIRSRFCAALLHGDAGNCGAAIAIPATVVQFWFVCLFSRADAAISGGVCARFDTAC